VEVKAFLLAAGRGTRLRPLTDDIPKCLVPVKGTPLLAIWLNLFKMHGVTDVLINTHHLAPKVEGFIADDTTGLNITVFHERRLLGSAGTVLANREFVAGQRCFIIAYADNLTNVDLGRMVEFHLGHKGVLTMGLFRTNRPRECGIAELGKDGLIGSFVEKPAEPRSDLANAGIYIASREIFDYIPRKEPVDFGFDVLPKLVGRMYGYEIKEYLMDIGTLENYARANREWPGL